MHEELDRLPDGQRLPVVLCDLEGLTYEQAAARLRWTEPTLRHRLVKARRRLRERLTRRGITAGRSGSSWPRRRPRPERRSRAALARSAVAAATGGAASAAAAALSATIIRSMLMTKLKIAAAGLLAATTLATAGVVAVGAGRTDEPGPAMKRRAHPKRRRLRDRPRPAMIGRRPSRPTRPARRSRAGSLTWKAGPSPAPRSGFLSSGRRRRADRPVRPIAPRRRRAAVSAAGSTRSATAASSTPGAASCPRRRTRPPPPTPTAASA